MTDFRKLKADLFADENGQVEKVEVNQRHLIDKILARYSAEFTVYREMIQNANDAGAGEIEISFETGKNGIETVIVRNNGRPFNDDDWRRLKRIAEGNPDEQKIGFFGVGFYSLFSICEEPLVVSGPKCMGFYWRGDQLYTRSGPTETASNDTSICLHLRDPLTLPDPDHFSQFLAKAVLFTQSLQVASFSIDGVLQFKVEKSIQPQAQNISTKSLKSLSTSSNLFTLKAIQPALLQISIDKRFHSNSNNTNGKESSFISGLWRLAQSHLTERGRKESALEEELRLPGTFSVTLQHWRATASVSAPPKFAAEMERTTKKRPFPQVFVDVIWPQQAASTTDSKHPVLSHLIPSTKTGKVYIGFETHQSTGLGLHLAAPFIPTVERESIDFVDGCLRQWNIELLQVAGKLSRLIYDRESEGDSLLAKGLLKMFAFTDSTPAPHVSICLFNEFRDQRYELQLPCQLGTFVPLSQLRRVPLVMQPFMKNCPQVPVELEAACKEFLERLSDGTASTALTLPTATLADVIYFECKKRQLEDSEIISLLKWWSTNRNPQLDREFMSTLRLRCSDGKNTVSLSQISLAPSEAVIGIHLRDSDWSSFYPVDCLPLAVAEGVAGRIRFVGGELTVAGWLEGLGRSAVGKEAIEGSCDRAERLLLCCSRVFNEGTDDLEQARIASVLASLSCIPVLKGTQLKLPRLCFFDDVAQEGLLPAETILSCSSEGRRSRLSAGMLKAAGVQTHLPLEQVVFGGKAEGSLSMLKYLLRHREELSRAELERLRNASIFRSDGGALMRLSDLFAPGEVTALLRLPVLAGEIPREGSELAAFMEQLGFNYTVPWRLVLGGVKAADSKQRALLFQYFFEHYAEYETFRPEEVDFPFLPVEGEEELLLLPSQVFLDAELRGLGFYLLSGELRRRAGVLGVKERPSSALIAQQTAQSRTSTEEAVKLFAYLSRVSFTVNDLQVLRGAPFIPCGDGAFRSAGEVFFANSSSSSSTGFAELFVRVDFEAAGNAFLRTVGVGDEPTIEQLIRRLCGGAGEILASIGPQRYIKMMEKFADGWAGFARKNAGLVKAFASASVFIASEPEKLKNNDSDSEGDEGDQGHTFKLYPVNEAFLIDDTIAQQIFALPSVPVQLNDFYAGLGCRWISTVVKTEWRQQGKPDANGPLARDTRKMITERSQLIISSLDSANSGDAGINRRCRKRLVGAKVVQVEAIKIARTCSVVRKEARENLQAACAYTDGQVIYVAYSRGRDFDAFDLAGVIVQLLCERRGRLQDSLLVASLLTTPLSSLRAKGFQITDMEVEVEQVDNQKPKVEVNEPTKQIESMKPIQEMKPIETIKPTNPINPEPIRPTRPVSPNTPAQNEPDGIKSFLGFIKSSTESLLSKLRSPSPDQLQRGTAGQGRDEESLQEALRRGIQSLKNHHPERSFSAEIALNDVAEEPKPRNQRIQRQLNDYCTAENADLHLYTVIGNGVSFYLPSRISDPDAQASIFESFNAALISFYRLIAEDLGQNIFSVPKLSSLSIFYDPDSSAIAFNRAHGIYFNLAYFISTGHAQQPTSLSVRSFWFITFCHELAHNFVFAHDAQHEYYMSSFLETYMPIFFDRLHQEQVKK